MSRKSLLPLIAALSLLLVLAACGEGEADEPPAPDQGAEAGIAPAEDDAGLEPTFEGEAVEPAEPESTVPPADVTQTIEAAQPGEQTPEEQTPAPDDETAPPDDEAATDAPPSAISPESAPGLVEVDRVTLETDAIVWADWSGENRLAAAVTSSGVYLIDLDGDRTPISINPTAPSSGDDNADDVQPRVDSAPARAQFAPGAPVLAVEPSAPDGQVTLWSLEDPNEPTTEDVLELNELAAGASRIAFSPEGDLLAMAGAAQPDRVFVYSLADGQLLHELEVEDFMTGAEGESRTVELFDFSPDGTLLAAEGGPGSGVVNVYRLDTGEQVERFEVGEPQEAPTPMPLIDPSWQRLAWFARGTIVIVDMQTGEEAQRMEHGSFVEAAVFSPDGRLLVTSSAEGSDEEAQPVVTLWDAETGEAVHTLTGFTGIVQALTFSDDGSLLVIGSSDGNLMLWGIPEEGE